MVAVIGDIHGCYFTLIELYSKIINKYPNIPVYTVGDLVDRGNHSYDVVNFILDEKIRFTPGNHDYMFYHFFKDPTSIFARSWVFNGNETTLESYENHEDAVFEHIESIKAAPLFYNLKDCFISHAGISDYYKSLVPNSMPVDISILKKFIYNDYKIDRGVLWTRDNLMDIGRLQVVGHTKQKEITFDEQNNSVYIDTGACVGNKLSAVIIHENEIIDTLEENSHLNDII